MSKYIHNRERHGIEVVTGNTGDGFTGRLIPGDRDFNPLAAGALRPSVLVDDDHVSDQVDALVASGHLLINDAVAPTRITTLTASTDLEGKVRLAWTNPLDASIRAIEIVRKQTSAPTSRTDGTQIAVLTAEELLVPGLQTFFDDVPALDATNYGYRIITHSSDRLYNDTTTAGMTAVGARDDAPGVVTDFNATVDVSLQVETDWTNPTAADLDSVVLLRKVGSYPTAHDDPDATTVFTDSSPTPGAANSYNDAAAVDGQLYYYAVFSSDTNGHWQDAVTVGNRDQGKRDDEPATVNTTTGVANTGPTRATLEWNNPTSVDLAEVFVRRKTGSYPVDSLDGTLVHQDLSPTPGGHKLVDDTTVAAATTYYYAVFTRDLSGKVNNTVSAATRATVIIP